MPHDEHIVDSDAHFKIDGKTRAVSNTQEIKTMVVQGDYKSERFTFELPKIIDGHDMSQTTTIQIHYINISSSTREQSVGVYEVDDVTTETSDDKDIIVFSWLLSGNATKYVGNLSFAIRFVCFDSLGDISYAWNTVVYSSITVSATINNGEEVVEEYTDILQSWYTRLFGEGESYLSAFQAIDESVKANASSAEEFKNSASQSAEAAANSEKIATDAAKESLGIRTLYSVVRPDLNGNLDPSSDMVVGPSESVSFTSNRNRLSNVTVHGYTIQEGEGDASLDNNREIENAGMFNGLITIDGTETFYGFLVRENSVRVLINFNSGRTKVLYIDMSNYLPCRECWNNDVVGFFISYNGTIVMSFPLYVGSTEEEVKAYLQSNPLKIIWKSEDDSDKIYTGIEIEQEGNYRCDIVELKDRLRKGDRLDTNIRSEFNAKMISNGSENWEESGFKGSYFLAVPNIDTTVLPQSSYLPSITIEELSSGEIGVSTNPTINLRVRLPGDADPKIYFAEKPITIFYKTLDNSISENVRREKHVRKTYAFMGTEDIAKSGLGSNTFYVNFSDIVQNGQAGAVVSNKAIALSEEQCISSSTWGVSGSATNPNTLRISSPETTVDAVKARLAEQYAAGTPFIVEYEMKIPKIYADEPIIVEHPSGTTTVNGESGSNVSIGFKPFQDGGDAETISGHTWQDILSAIDEAVKAASQTET